MKSNLPADASIQGGQNRYRAACCSEGKETPPTHSKVYQSITEPRSLSDRVKKRRHTLECVPRNYGPGPVTSHSIEFPFLWSSGRATWTRSLRLLGSVVSGCVFETQRAVYGNGSPCSHST